MNKQKTIEEAAKDTTNKYINEREKQTAYLEFIEGVIWQAERMYSEEDLKLILQLFVKDTRGNSPWVDADDEWFEQFKKK
jgi:hypothetical protein